MLRNAFDSGFERLARTAVRVAFAALTLAIVDAASTTDPISEQQISSEIELLVSVAPEYPAEAATAGIEGFVTLEFTITENGRVADIVVLEAVPETIFVDSAVHALSNWLFKPATSHGVAIARRAAQTIEFHLDRDAPE